MIAYLGVDPGAGGGFAWLNEFGEVIKTVKMPITEIEIWTALDPQGVPDEDGSAAEIKCVIEGVGASPQMGTRSAFTFGRGYGGLLMALTGHGIDFSIVYPVKWQNALDCRTGGDKNISKRKAESLWPKYKITHYCADALLLAEYSRRLHQTAF